MDNKENPTDADNNHQQIIYNIRVAMYEAFVFLKNSDGDLPSFKDMLKKLTNLAVNSGCYQLFYKLSRYEKALFSNDKTKHEGMICRTNVLCSIESIRNTIKSRKDWTEGNKIISNTKFEATIVPEDSTPIKNIDITVNAERNDIMIIKVPIPTDRKDRDIIDKKLWGHVGNEIFNIPNIFKLNKCKSGEYELYVEQMRIRSHKAGDVEGERYCEFHVEKGVLTVHKRNKAKMVYMNILKLLGNMQTGYRIDTPFGTIGVKRNTFHNKLAVGSIFIEPLEREKSDTWHSNSRKILRDTVPLMRFITTKSLEVSLEEHRYNDRSEFYFDKDIDKVYPVLANHSLEHLIKKIFKRSHEGSFAEDISKLAEAATIANTYSPSWKIRLICMIEALETWGSHEKFNLLHKHFPVKLMLFFKKYIDKPDSDYVEELIRVRNNLMHKGIATSFNFKNNKSKDKIHEQKDESQYYFFKFRELFVEIFLFEIKWEGEYYSYSCSEDGIVTHTKEKR